MRNDNRLSAKQKAFVRSMRNDAAVMSTVVEELEVQPARVTRWFRHPVFRQTLRDALREVRRLGDAELELGARVAKQMVSQMLAGKLKLDRLMLTACFGVIEAHARLRVNRKPSRGRRQPEKPKGPKHPGHDDERGKQLLNKLNESAKAAREARAKGNDAMGSSVGPDAVRT